MMHITHHKIRVKEPTTKLPKHLDKETFMNAVNRGDIPIKIPNISNAPEEYLCNFNGIANYCNFRNNQSYKNPDLFTWTLKQQQFNPYAIPKEFQNRNKKIGATPRKITSDSKLKEEIEKPLVLLNIENKNNNILNPPKRVQVYNAHRFSEKEVKKMEKEEADYEEKIRALIKTKWNDIVRNSNRLKHRKIFSITKMQNDALYDDKNSSFMDTVMVESSGMSQFSQKNHFLNPFDKKNFGINKIIHYIKAKNENNDLKDLFEPMNPKKINVVKQKFLKEKKVEEIHHDTEGSSLIKSEKHKNSRTKSYINEFEKKLENAKRKTESNNPEQNEKVNLRILRPLKFQKALLNEDNILNYNSYFSKRYYNTGFRLELSEKGRNVVKIFENKLKNSIMDYENE